MDLFCLGLDVIMSPCNGAHGTMQWGSLLLKYVWFITHVVFDTSSSICTVVKARFTQKDSKRLRAKDRLRQVKTMKFEANLCKIF